MAKVTQKRSETEDDEDARPPVVVELCRNVDGFELTIRAQQVWGDTIMQPIVRVNIGCVRGTPEEMLDQIIEGAKEARMKLELKR